MSPLINLVLIPNVEEDESATETADVTTDLYDDKKPTVSSHQSTTTAPTNYTFDLTKSSILDSPRPKITTLTDKQKISKMREKVIKASSMSGMTLQHLIM